MWYITRFPENRDAEQTQAFSREDIARKAGQKWANETGEEIVLSKEWDSFYPEENEE